MDGSEKLRSADVLEQFEQTEPYDQGTVLPTDTTTALHVHPAPPESGRSPADPG